MKWLMIVLVAILTVAKLTHTIAWSWWIVLLPLWIYLGLVALIWLIAFMIALATSDN